MRKYRATLIIEKAIELPHNGTHEDAEEYFWDLYHNDKDALAWELVVEEQTDEKDS